MKVEEKKTLLLVEDEIIIALTKQKELEKYGYTVLTVNTGEKAIAISKENHEIDLILMDIDLGRGIDGTEAAELILRDWDIPVVFMSSHMEPEVVEKTEKITSYGYIVKSSSITVLDASIKMAFKLFKAHKKIYESEEKYRSLFEQAGDYILLLEVTEDKDIIIVDANQAACEIHGYAREQFIGKSITDLDRALDENQMRDLLERILSGEPTLFVTKHVKKDGTIFPIEVSAKLLKTEKDRQIIITTERDIIERKQVETKLQQSQYYLTKAQDIGKIGTWELDIQKNILRWTKENYKIFGIPFGTSMNYDLFLECAHPDDRDYVNEKWNAGLNREPYDIEHRIIADDTIKWVREKAEIDFDTEGNPTIAIGVTQDISDRKKAEEKENEHRRKIEFLSTTAMKFVEFPEDNNVYDYIGEKLKEIIGKESYIILNSVDEKTKKSTVHTVLGLKGITDKLIKLLGQHPVGMTFDVEDPNIFYSDGKAHHYKEGIYGLLLKTVPKTICNSIEKLLKIKDIYIIDLAKQGRFFGSVIILLKDESGELKNKQLIETFIKQASIAVQRTQTEKKLQQSQYYLTRAQEIGGIGTWELDLQNNILQWTDENYNIFGVPLGTEMTDELFLDCVHPDDRNYINEKWSAGLNKEPYDIEYRLIVNDNVKWVREKAEIEFDKKDTPVMAIGFTQDITWRKQAEELLFESESSLASAQRIANIGSWKLELATAAVYWSDELFSIFGLNPESGPPSWPEGHKNLYHPDDWVRSKELIEKCIANGESYTIENRIIRETDKAILHTIARGAPQYSNDGNIKAYIGTIQDITEQKQLEQKLYYSKLQLEAVYN